MFASLSFLSPSFPPLEALIRRGQCLRRCGCPAHVPLALAIPVPANVMASHCGHFQLFPRAAGACSALPQRLTEGADKSRCPLSPHLMEH